MTGWLLSATALVAAVLVLRRVLRRHLHPAVLYALWLLAAARLLLPFNVGTSDLSLSAAASAIPWCGRRRRCCRPIPAAC